METDRLPEVLASFLGNVATLSLATVDDDGRPHAANLLFVADDELDLFFLSHPDSAHARHVAARPAAAVTAYAPFETVEQIRGVQMHGRCGLLEAAAFDAVLARFRAKFPHAAGLDGEEPFYRFRPFWVRWIDNSVRFRFKLESPWPVA